MANKVPVQVRYGIARCPDIFTFLVDLPGTTVATLKTILRSALLTHVGCLKMKLSIVVPKQLLYQPWAAFETKVREFQSDYLEG